MDRDPVVIVVHAWRYVMSRALELPELDEGLERALNILEEARDKLLLQRTGRKAWPMRKNI